MQAIRSILVVIEPDQLEGLALKRAQLIAGVTQSHLHLLVCEKRRDHSAALNDLACQAVSTAARRSSDSAASGTAGGWPNCLITWSGRSAASAADGRRDLRSRSKTTTNHAAKTIAAITAPDPTFPLK